VVLVYHHRELAVLTYVYLEPVVLAYHHRELAIPANPWMRVTYNT
jgi:hypothetical protein